VAPNAVLAISPDRFAPQDWKISGELRRTYLRTVVSARCGGPQDLGRMVRMCRRGPPRPDASLRRAEWEAQDNDQGSEKSSGPLVFRAQHGRLPSLIPPQPFRPEQMKTCIVTPMLRWDVRSYIWCFASMLDRSAQCRINFHISNGPKSAARDHLPRISAVVVQDGIQQRVAPRETVVITASGDVLVTLRPGTKPMCPGPAPHFLNFASTFCAGAILCGCEKFGW
jgi:hypothetical protein